MLAPQLLHRVDPFRSGSGQPVAPRLVRLVESALRHHPFDRRHGQILPTGLATNCGNSSPITEQSPTQSASQEHPPWAACTATVGSRVTRRMAVRAATARFGVPRLRRRPGVAPRKAVPNCGSGLTRAAGVPHCHYARRGTAWPIAVDSVVRVGRVGNSSRRCPECHAQLAEISRCRRLELHMANASVVALVPAACRTSDEPRG